MNERQTVIAPLASDPDRAWMEHLAERHGLTDLRWESCPRGPRFVSLTGVGTPDAVGCVVVDLYLRPTTRGEA